MGKLVVGFVCVLVLVKIAATEDGYKKAVVLTEKDAYKVVSVKTGGTFEVRLKAMHGVGYLWDMVGVPKFLEGSGEPVVEHEKADGKVVGGEETEVFKFKVLNVDAKYRTAEIEFRYFRPFEDKIVKKVGWIVKVVD